MKKPTETPAQLLSRFVAQTGYTEAEILGPCRTKRLFEARRHVAFQLRTQGFSFPEIGRLLNRDHSTVMNMLRDEPRKRAKPLPAPAPAPAPVVVRTCRYCWGLAHRVVGEACRCGLAYAPERRVG